MAIGGDLPVRLLNPLYLRGRTARPYLQTAIFFAAFLSLPSPAAGLPSSLPLPSLP